MKIGWDFVDLRDDIGTSTWWTTQNTVGFTRSDSHLTVAIDGKQVFHLLQAP